MSQDANKRQAARRRAVVHQGRHRARRRHRQHRRLVHRALAAARAQSSTRSCRAPNARHESLREVGIRAVELGDGRRPRSVRGRRRRGDQAPASDQGRRRRADPREDPRGGSRRFVCIIDDTKLVGDARPVSAARRGHSDGAVLRRAANGEGRRPTDLARKTSSPTTAITSSTCTI